MLLILLSIISLLLVLWLCVSWHRVKKYWSARGVPFVPPHPLVGSLAFIISGNLSLWIRNIYETYKSPYVGIWMFWRPALVINSPDIIHNILTRDSSAFRNRFASSGPSDPLGSLNIFTLDDPLWSTLRRRLSNIFTSAKLRSLQTLISGKIKELNQRIHKEKDGCDCLRTIYADYTTDIIGAITFGVNGDATLTGDGPMRRITKGFTQFNLYRSISWSSVFFFPELVDIFRFTVFPRSTTAFFRKVFSMIVKQRLEHVKGTADPTTLLDTLIQLSQKGPDGTEGFSEDVLVAQVAVFMFAGVDSTATTLAFLTYELAHSPDIQARLYQELLEAKQRSPDKDIVDTKILANLVYLNCVIKEAVRKYPAMGWLDRIASRDYVIDENLTIEAGTPLCINSTGLHYDPRYFPDPDIFNPDRFAPDNENNIVPFTYLPFGDGPRVCIGQRFANMHIQHAIAAVILAFEVRPAPNVPKPSELKFDPFALFLAPAKPLHLQFIPRTTS